MALKQNKTNQNSEDLFCPLCKSKELLIEYEGPIRSGGVGSLQEYGYKVLTCLACDATFLEPFPENIISYYENDTYWSSRSSGNSIDILSIRNKADKEQHRWLNKIGSSVFRDKKVVEIGAGCGSFLDHIKGLASETIGIEASATLGSFLINSGHNHLKYTTDCKSESVDLAVCFDTLEHIKYPDKFIAEIWRILKSGGQIYVGVPNRDDFLKKCVEIYKSHFFHKSHLWYFSGKRLTSLLIESHFKNTKLYGVHKYDLMNMIVWTRDGLAKGKTDFSVFDELTENSFCREIERQLVSSHILCQGTKKI